MNIRFITYYELQLVIYKHQMLINLLTIVQQQRVHPPRHTCLLSDRMSIFPTFGGNSTMWETNFLHTLHPQSKSQPPECHPPDDSGTAIKRKTKNEG